MAMTSRDQARTPVGVRGWQDDKNDIFGVRYLAYFESGHLDPMSDQLYFDEHDTSPLTLQLAGYNHGSCVGALRVSFTQLHGLSARLPCESHFCEIGDVASYKSVEISKLAVNPEITNLSFRTTLYATLVRAALIAAEAANCERIVISTKGDWVRFYEAMLGAKVIGTPAFYPPGNVPISMLQLPIGEARRRQKLQNGFFKYDGSDVDDMGRKIHAAVLATTHVSHASRPHEVSAANAAPGL